MSSRHFNSRISWSLLSSQETWGHIHIISTCGHFCMFTPWRLSKLSWRAPAWVHVFIYSWIHPASQSPSEGLKQSQLRLRDWWSFSRLLWLHVNLKTLSVIGAQLHQSLIRDLIPQNFINLSESLNSHSCNEWKKQSCEDELWDEMRGMNLSPCPLWSTCRPQSDR